METLCLDAVAMAARGVQPISRKEYKIAKANERILKSGMIGYVSQKNYSEGIKIWFGSIAITLMLAAAYDAFASIGSC